MNTKSDTSASSPAPTRYVGLQLDKVHLITADGEPNTVFEHVQLMPTPARNGTDRQLQINFRDTVPDLVSGTVEMLKAFTSPAGVAAAAKQLKLDLPLSETSANASKAAAKPSQRTDDDLLATFVEYVRDRPIPYLKRDGELGDDEIGIAKREQGWDRKRTFLFSATIQAIFPDRNAQRRLVKALQGRDIIRPNPSPKDTATVTVTVNGTGRKAYRLATKRYRELLEQN